MTLLRNKKAVFFDHDGTLVDSEGVYFQLWCELLGEKRECFSLDLYKKYCVGVPASGTASFLVRQFGLSVSPETLMDARATLTQSYLQCQPFPLMPGAMDVILQCAQKQLRMAIVSGSERNAVLNSVVGHELHSVIEMVTTGDQVPNNKPAPDVYLHCLNQMGLQATECIAIEDTEHGVAAACDAGIEVIAVPNQYTKAHDFSQATMVLPHLRALAELF